MGRVRYAFLIMILIFAEISLYGRQPFRARVTVDDDMATVTAPNLLDLKRDLNSSSIEDLIPIYTPVSPVSFGINLRGILAEASFAANSTTLVVTIPKTAESTSFTGSTRDESLGLFKEFVKDGGSRHKLLKAYARYSPIDPVAGNPNSLLALMGEADYLLGELSPQSGCDCSWSAQPIVNQVQGGMRINRTFAGGYDTTNVTIPLRYSYSPDLNYAFIIDAPMTYLRNGGASSLVGSLGLGLRIPILSGWSLTPIVRFGGGGSLDLATSGSFVSTGLNSVITCKISNFLLTVTNYASYVTSTNLWLSGINFNYHLHNYVLKNGFKLTTCEAFCLWGRALDFSLSFVDSYIGRNRFYIRHYDEVGISLITKYLNPYLDYDCLSVGFAFQFGQHRLRGYTLNLAYQF